METAALVARGAGALNEFGFRVGERGTHSTRTIMVRELTTLLNDVPARGTKDDYRAGVETDNVLGKKTASTRSLTFKRLSELYALDRSVTLFRVLRECWDWNQGDRPVLAILCALARDPLLRITADPVLSARIGTIVTKATLRDAIAEETHGRLNSATVDKVARNAASSWTQSGHLQGRVRKVRSQAPAGEAAVAYALLLGYLEGVRGTALFDTLWARVLDRRPDELHRLAAAASRSGRFTYRHTGAVADIRFDTLLTKRERELTHEPH